jgi:hypothetical protein
MIYNLVAFPSRFSEWCERLVCDLTAAAFAPPSSRRRGTKSNLEPIAVQSPLSLIYGDSMAHIGWELLKLGCAHAVVVSRQPHADTCRVIKSLGRPFLVVLDNPAAAVSALMSDHHLAYVDAVRTLAGSSASLLQLVSDANALVLRPERALDLHATALRIVEHFGFKLEDQIVNAILSRTHLEALAARIQEAVTKDLSQRRTDSVDLPTLTNTDVADDPFAGDRLTPMLQGAIEPFWRVLQGGHMEEVVWRRDFFFKGDNRAEAATGVMSLTGPSRCLSFGPYLRLPHGPWSCRVIFACNDRAVGTQMMADAYGGGRLGKAQFMLTESGIFEVEFSFVNENPDAPIEVRLFNMTACLDGHIALGEVRLSPLELKRLPVTQ